VFRDVYDELAPRLHRFIVRMVGDGRIAEDLLQDTWLSLARHAPNLEPDVDLAAWMFTVARNKVRSWRRFALFDRMRVELFSREPVKGSVGNAEQAYAAGEEQKRLEVALARLPASHREVLLLVAVEELNATQAGHVLGLRPDAVRQRLSRARALLQSEVDRLGSGPPQPVPFPGGADA
jgi:RNA polymerase sigma-70 factor (ECF subfamily)